MRSRRFFLGCGICAAVGFTATGVSAQAPAPSGIKRRILQRIDGPAPGFETLIVEIEVEADFAVARHTHPGIESSYVMAGTSTLLIDGQPPRALQPGDTFQIPVGAPHAVKNGPTPSKLIGNFIVEKGKPLASPAA